jgi:hypothetical protein
MSRNKNAILAFFVPTARRIAPTPFDLVAEHDASNTPQPVVPAKRAAAYS